MRSELEVKWSERECLDELSGQSFETVEELRRAALDVAKRIGLRPGIVSVVADRVAQKLGG